MRGPSRRQNRACLGITAALGMAFTLVAFGQQAAQLKGGLDGTDPAVWHARGSANWRVDKGEIVGTVRPGGGGGWLVRDRGYQDLAVKLSFRCTGDCQSGILLGMEKAGDRTTGLYVSLADADLSAYEMTLDSQGQEIERRKPALDGENRGGSPGTTGGGAVAAGGGIQGGRGAVLAAPAGHPLSVPRPPASVRRNEWNHVEVRLFTAVNAHVTSLNVVLNGSTVSTGYPAPTMGPAFGQTDRIALRPQFGRFGPLALRVSGSTGAEVRFKDVSILNYTEIVPTVEKVSNRFSLQQVTPYFHGDGSCVADLDRNGALDIVAGHMAWMGPDFRKGRTIDITYPLDVTNYGATISCEAADFTGDGWPDVVETSFPGGGPVYLYVNPQNELRRWTRHKVLENTMGGTSEIVESVDVDRDGKAEFVYGGDGYAVNYAEPDPADPTKPWIVHHLTERANWGPHGLGVGDVNGDGRIDVLRGWGWWEQPSTPTHVPWTFHPEAFGRAGQGAGGGAQIQVYDVNGDGLNDVVTSLEAHAYGLAWFEQRRDNAGNISFVQHMIMDRNPALSHGVVFTEMHGLALGDVDGDGLKDIITGKHRDHNLGNHHYSYSWPSDEDAENTFYWFKLVRQPGAKVDYVPHLIHNNSGVGRQPRALDLNGDGMTDLVNSGRFGTMIFFGRKGAVD